MNFMIGTVTVIQPPEYEISIYSPSFGCSVSRMFKHLWQSHKAGCDNDYMVSDDACRCYTCSLPVS